DPGGPGRPCYDKLTWLQVMLDRTWAALQRRCRHLPSPLGGADSWFGDSGLIEHIATSWQGTLLVEGKTSYVFSLPDGRPVKGRELAGSGTWPGRGVGHMPGGTVCPADSDQPHLWCGHRGHCGGGRRGALLPAVPGDDDLGTPSDPGLEAAELD